jgi:hypothetical protein
MVNLIDIRTTLLSQVAKDNDLPCHVGAFMAWVISDNEALRVYIEEASGVTGQMHRPEHVAGYLWRETAYASLLKFSPPILEHISAIKTKLGTRRVSRSFLHRGYGHGLILSCSSENQRRQTAGCGARTVAGSREAIFPRSYISVI